MSVTRLRRGIDAGNTGDGSASSEMRADGEALRRQNATPRHGDTTVSGTRTGAVEAALRWCALGVALALAVSLGIWLQK